MKIDKFVNRPLYWLCLFTAVMFFIPDAVQAQSPLNWVKPSFGRLPKDAVPGGSESDGTVLYVCRTSHEKTAVSGKIVGGKCNYNWGAVEYSSTDFEVLTGAGYYWSAENTDYRNAVFVGQSGRETFYVCRANTKVGVHPGRLRGGKCEYGYGGKGFAANDIEILYIGDTKVAGQSLLVAAQAGNAQAVREALRAGQAINQKNQSGQTPLMLASSIGAVDSVRVLLNGGAGVDVRDNTGNTALIYAAWKGFPQVVEMLLRSGANFNVRNNNGDTAFVLAASGGNEEIVRGFLSDGTFRSGNLRDAERALRAAAFNGHNSVLRVLLDEEIDINSIDESGQTALMRAAANKQAETVSFLLRNGANLKFRDNKQYSAFQVAVFADADNVLRVLMSEGGIKPNTEEAQRGLHNAAWDDKRNALKFLIQWGVDVNSQNAENGNTALMWAAGKGFDEALEILIKSGANLNAQNQRGETALMMAAANSKKNTLQALVKAGANLNLTDKSGKTALGLAIQNNHKDTRKELEKAGAKQ